MVVRDTVPSAPAYGVSENVSKEAAFAPEQTHPYGAQSQGIVEQSSSRAFHAPLGEFNHQKTYPALPHGGRTSLTQNVAQKFRFDRLQQFCEELDGEVTSNEKKLKTAKKRFAVFENLGYSSSILTAVLGSSGFASALTVIGIPVTAALASCAVFTGVVSGVSSFVAFKKLNPSVKKYNELLVCAKLHKNLLNTIISNALDNDVITDEEFKIALKQMDTFRNEKAIIAKRLTKRFSVSGNARKNVNETQLREQIRNEELKKIADKQEKIKKIMEEE